MLRYRLGLPTPELEQALRRITDLAAGGLPDADVLLDVSIDGIRCVLVREASPSAAERLTPREAEIAGLVAAGSTDRTIATRLGISTWTVGAHIRRIFAKLGVSSRAAMVARLTNLPPQMPGPLRLDGEPGPRQG